MAKVRKLKNGIRVVMEKTEFVKSVAVGFWIKTGAFNEERSTWGISHFIEHMMFKGTENRDAKKIAEDVDRLGGQINAFTSKEATCYYIKTLSSNLVPSMEILVDMLTESKFDKEELDRERRVIIEEMKMIEDTPDDDAHEMISTLVNKGNSFERSIIGTPSSLKKINRNTILKYIEDEYTKDNIVVALAGNFDEERVINFLEGKLDKFKDTKDVKEYVAEEYKPAFKVKVKEIEQSHIFLGTPSVKLRSEDYYKVQLVANILGGSMSSRLFQSVRERKGLAYSVYAMNTSTSHNGNFLIYAGVAHESLQGALKEIKNQLQLMADGQITQDELDKVKEQMKAGIVFGLENISSKMFYIGRSITLNGDLISEDEVIKTIDGISLNDLKNISKWLCNPENYSIVAITNKKMNLKSFWNRA